MRFLMLNWRDPRNPLSGGAERVTLAYLKALVDRGHEAYWFANDYPGATREERFEGIKIVRGGGKGSAVLKAKQWHRQQPRFDLVIDQHHGIPWYAPWWCKTHCVAYIHEVLGPIWNSFYRWPTSSIGQWQERWTHWFYRDVPFWTPSDSTKSILRSHGVKQIHVFLNGTDTTPVSSLEKKPITAPLQLVTVSRLAPNKRVEHAIQSAKILLQRGTDVRLTVVGSGDSEPSLRRLVSEIGLSAQVQFTGLVDEQAKNKILREAHILLHTSVREGWGLNVIEANAMGTPAAVYPVAGLVDSTLHNQTGMVTRNETPEAMADAVLAISQSQGIYETLRVNAWKRSQSLQWDQVLPPACRWLESAAAGNP